MRTLLLALLVSRAAAQAPADVRESRFEASVVLDAGIADITLRSEITRALPRRAEVEASFPLPVGGELVSLEVCRGRRCRRAARPPESAWPDPFAIALHGPARGRSALPIARASVARGVVTVVAAPIDGRTPLAVTLRIAAPVAVEGGVLRLDLPARSATYPLAATELAVTARDAGSIAIASQPTPGASARATVPPGAIAIAATLARSSLSVAHAPCAPRAAGPCTAAVVATPREARLHDVVLAIDVSPSMADVEPGRLTAAIRSLLAALPGGSRVRALRFGARARWVDTDFRDPRDLDADALASDEVPGALGSRTRFSAIAPLADEAITHAIDPLLIVVGDGWLDDADFASLAASGMRTVVANVSDGGFDRATMRAVHATPRTLAITLGARDASVLASEPTGPFTFRDASGRATLLGPLASGEATSLLSASVRGRLDGIASHRASAAEAAMITPGATDALLAIDRRVFGDLSKWRTPSLGVPRVPGGVGGVDDAITPAPYPWMTDGHRLRARAAPRIPRIRIAQARVRATASIRTFRRMLVRQIRPVVDGCFTAARRGRPRWSARAELGLVLAHREVLDARILSHAGLEPATIACIVAATEDLQIPFFEGTVVLRQPFTAPALERPAAIPLAPETERALDALELPSP